MKYYYLVNLDKNQQMQGPFGMQLPDGRGLIILSNDEDSQTLSQIADRALAEDPNTYGVAVFPVEASSRDEAARKIKLSWKNDEFQDAIFLMDTEVEY
jgi:hypothetical protein